jgi:uncharacterized small protein (DUF1192 family)
MPTKDFRALQGMLKHLVERPLSVEEMNETIGRFHAEEMRRIEAGLADSDAGDVTSIEDVRKEFGLD